MNTQQKFVKYLATALAIILIITIISGSIIGILFLTNIIPNSNNAPTANIEKIFIDDNSGHRSSGHHDALTIEDFSSHSYSFDNIKNIELDASIYSISFSKGNTDKIIVDLTNVHNDYTVEQTGDTLILDSSYVDASVGLDNFFDLLDNASINFKNDASIRITLPENFKANKIELDGGVGNIVLNDLCTEILEIDAGVGNITGTGILATSSDIDCGVGNITLDFADSRDNYFLSLEKGLGSLKIDGQSMGINDSYSENHGATNTLNISGGIGDVTISFANSF